MTEKATRPRRWRLYLAAPLLALLVLEAAAFLVASIIAGEPCGHGCHAARRRAVLESPGAVAARPPRESATRAPWVEGILADQVIHPFLGFVDNPDRSERNGEGAMHPQGRAHGFIGNAHALFQEKREDRLIVVVLGGSVARQVSEVGRLELEAALGEVPRYAGREVRVLTLAVGGYKAPQPLLSLVHMLSLGLHADVVILLDGLNDIALAAKDNVPSGVHPAYPRLWKERVTELDETAAMLRGEIRFLDRQRRRLARLADSAPWRFSLAANALWGVADRRLGKWLEQRLGRLGDQIEAKELSGGAGGGRSFVSHGPPFEELDARGLARESVALWERSARQLQALAAGQGFEFHHFLQPNQYDGRKPLLAHERRQAFHEESPFKQSVEIAYPLLRQRGEALRSSGVAFHDLSGIFEGVREPLYVDFCCHVNRRGIERLAEAIGETIAAEDALSDSIANTVE